LVGDAYDSSFHFCFIFSKENVHYNNAYIFVSIIEFELNFVVVVVVVVVV
jgi:hypothetical protein